MLPADRGKVAEQHVRDYFAAAAQVVERPAKIYGVPKRDRGGDEGKPARTVLPRLDRPIAQSAEAVKADGAGEGVARFALVELDGRLPPEPRQLEPVEHEQRALDPADFAQGQRQTILAGIAPSRLRRSEALACRWRSDSPQKRRLNIPQV